MIDPLKFAELKASGRLPSPSRITLELIEKLKREDVPLAEICRLIQSDPALTGRFLKLANSAAYARARPAAVVTPEVLMLLGLPTVRNLILAFSLIDGVRGGQAAHFDYQAFWRRSLAEACAAQSVGMRLHVAPPGELFTLGLIADVGRLALASLEPERHDGILARAGSLDDTEQLATEEAVAFGFDHRELTAALLAEWGLPKLFCDAARWHDAPKTHWPFEQDSRSARLTETLALSHRLADTFALDDDSRRDAAHALLPLAERLGIQDWLAAADAALTAWREWGELLALAAPTLTPFLTLSLMPRQIQHDATQRALAIEDDPVTRRLLESLLVRAGFEARSAADGDSGLALALSWRPDIVVTDILMPGKSGLDVIRDLRAADNGHLVYVIVVTVLDATDKLVEAFALGADDYVTKPIDAAVLMSRLQAGVRFVRLRQELIERNLMLAEALMKAEEAALTDALTGLPNRRYAITRLEQECAAAERAARPLSVLMIDIDHFKRVNDRLGHAAGDMALIEIARRLRDTARVSDVVTRLGGEEFLVIAPDTDQDKAVRLAERLRQSVAARAIRAGDEPLIATVSIGVKEKTVSGCLNVDQLLAGADSALYEAKAAGRDCVRTG